MEAGISGNTEVAASAHWIETSSDQDSEGRACLAFPPPSCLCPVAAREPVRKGMCAPLLPNGPLLEQTWTAYTTLSYTNVYPLGTLPRDEGCWSPHKGSARPSQSIPGGVPGTRQARRSGASRVHARICSGQFCIGKRAKARNKRDKIIERC